MAASPWRARGRGHDASDTPRRRRRITRGQSGEQNEAPLAGTRGACREQPAIRHPPPELGANRQRSAGPGSHQNSPSSALLPSSACRLGSMEFHSGALRKKS